MGTARRSTVWFVVAIMAGALVARAVPTQQLTLNATQDTYVSVANPATNYGTLASMQHTAGWYPSQTNMEYLYVDFGNVLAALPPGAAIYSAKVNLTRTSDPGTTNARIGLAANTWNETTLTWNTRFNSSDWYYRNTLGAATAVPVTTLADVTAHVDKFVRAGTTSYTLWTSSGGEDPNPSRTAVFNTREAASGGPSLVVDYVPASAFTADTNRVLRLQEGLNGYAGTADTWISTRSPAVNHGAEATLATLENNWGGQISRGFVKFDTSMLQGGGITVSNAVLTLMPFSYQTSASIPVQVREVLRPWTENATYATYDGTNAWAAAGALGVGDTSAVIASTTLDASAWGMLYLDVTSSLQSWVLNPSSNNGWLIDAVSATQNIVYNIGSSESGSAHLRPQLWVTYTPEPGALVLLGLAAGALTRRRRRG